jgi:hypothetical protein
VVDDTDPAAESDLRRRAAWLLGMLVIVAVLFVVLLTVVVNSGDGHGAHHTTGALDGAAAGQPSSPRTTQTSPTVGTSRTSAPNTSVTTAPAAGDTTCPTASPCMLTGDAGGAVAAVNAARAAKHQPAISGQVSPAAQQCALEKGNGCAGSWAVTWGSADDGAALVAKIPSHDELLDPKLTGFQVGWAYYPGAKTYYLAIIRNS